MGRATLSEAVIKEMEELRKGNEALRKMIKVYQVIEWLKGFLSHECYMALTCDLQTFHKVSYRWNSKSRVIWTTQNFWKNKNILLTAFEWYWEIRSNLNEGFFFFFCIVNP